MIRNMPLGSLILLATAAILGCAQETPPASQPTDRPQASAAPTSSDAAEHSHGSGPHGGTIADWGGGDYHVELVVDHDKKEATVYILGGDVKSPVPIKAEKIQLNLNDPYVQIDLAAQPLDAEGDGKSSRFVGQNDNLGIVREFEGTISGEVEGTPYVGEFKEGAEEHTH